MLKGTSLAGAILLAGIAVLSPAAFGQTSSSCWLRDAAAPTPTTAYVLCEQGTLYVTTDGGKSWSTRETAAKVPLKALAFTDAAHGLAVGNGGTLIATEDSGKTWQERKTDSKENLLAVAAIGNRAWAAGYDGELLASTDGGRTWAKQKSGVTQALEDIYFADAEHGWAVGWSGTILRTTDGGKTWESVESKEAQWSLTSVYFPDVKNGWTVGFAGQMLRSTDGGATWQKVDPNLKAWLKDVAVDRSNRLWVAADDQLLVSENQGQTWKSVPVSAQAFLRRFTMVGDSLWAVGQLAVLRQTGNEWKLIETLVPRAAGATQESSRNPAPKKQ